MSSPKFIHRAARAPARMLAMLGSGALVAATFVTFAAPSTAGVTSLLWDQPPPSVNGFTSQSFEAELSAATNQGAEDFVVPAGSTWTVSSVDAFGGYYSWAGPAASMNVYFYADDSGKPGASVSTLLGQSYSTTYYGTVNAVLAYDFAIPLSTPVTLTSGHYWVSVQARQDFDPAGQWWWLDAAPQLNAGQWQNPGGYFGTCTTWGTRTACIGGSADHPDFAFRLYGTSELGTKVHVTDSTGAGLAGVTVNYNCGGPTLAFGTTDATGYTAPKTLPPTSVCSLTAAYRGTAATKTLNPVGSTNVVDFQTSAVTVTLTDHAGGPLPGGTASYKAGPSTYYLTTGSSATDATGKVVGELFDGSYAFRMTYHNGEQWTTPVAVTNGSTIAFQTGLLKVVYSGELSYGGPVGDSAWFTKNGTELLPGTYSFHPRGVGYPAGTGCKPITITAPDPGTIATKTIVAAQLRDSTGSPLTGTAQFYPNAVLGWQPIGTTDGTGSVCTVYNGSLGSTTVGMTYNGTYTQKAQTVATNSVFAFQTTDVTVQLKDSVGTLIDTGSASYYAGSWKPIGTTSSGVVHAQMLQGSYAFGMSYLGTYTQKNAQPVSGATSTVTFQTGQVVSDSGHATGYYANGWKTFTSGMELLPGTWPFQFDDGTAQTSYTISPATTNHIH